MYVSMLVCPYVCLCVSMCVRVCVWCMCVRAIIDVKLLLIPDPNWFRSRGGGSYISDNV